MTNFPIFFKILKDVTLAKDMNDDFQSWLARQNIADPMKMDFYMMILSSGSWPFSPDVNDTFLLPQVVSYALPKPYLKCKMVIETALIIFIVLHQNSWNHV